MLQPILFLLKNMQTTTQPAIEQQQVHIFTQVQEYERKKMKWVQESLTKLLAEYIPKKSVHRFADFYFGAIAFYFKLLMWSKMRPLVHKVRFCYHSHSHLH